MGNIGMEEYIGMRSIRVGEYRDGEIYRDGGYMDRKYMYIGMRGVQGWGIQ